MNKSDEFIKELEKTFSQDIEMPESLSKNNMVKMLKNQNIAAEKKTVKLFPKIISAAAVMAIVAIAALTVGLDKNLIERGTTTTVPAVSVIVSEESATEKETVVEESTQSEEIKLKKAKSEKDLVNHFLKLYAENKLDDYVDYLFSYGFSDDVKGEVQFSADSAVNENMAPTAAPVMSQAVTQSAVNSTTGTVPHGTTNLQVTDVDEGDIIKNDGKYLYIVNNYSSGNSKITIVDTEMMKTVYAKGIEAENGDLMKINDIYINGDILTAVCNYEEDTIIVVYDVSKRFAPAEIRRTEQDGIYQSSRMVDGVIYTLTNYRVRGSSKEEIEENAIPKIDCDCIAINNCYIMDKDSETYIVLSALDTTKKDSEVSSLSLLSNAYEIYSTSDTLYVYDSIYDEDGTYTQIYSFSIDGTSINLKASGTFKGYCINRYALDEYDGNLRVAACYYDYKTNLDVSCVYILNPELEIIGEVTDLAKDEEIKAVRFMGETGYVVTFRNTDPLFILDLSDPKNPTVTGELKIPGYSTYIHPLSDNYLVGIGYDGTDENADLNKVKVSVFDVSDKSEPKETDTFIIKDAYSLVNENPKAFFYYTERKLIGIPVNKYDDNGNVTKGIQTLTVENGTVTSHVGFVHYSGSENHHIHSSSSSSSVIYCYGYYPTIFRGTYIGNLLYTIDDSQVIEHDLDTGDRTRICMLDTKEAPKAEVEFSNKKETAAETTTVTIPTVEPTTAVTGTTLSETTIPPYIPGTVTTQTSEPQTETSATEKSEYSVGVTVSAPYYPVTELETTQHNITTE